MEAPALSWPRSNHVRTAADTRAGKVIRAQAQLSREHAARLATDGGTPDARPRSAPPIDRRSAISTAMTHRMSRTRADPRAISPCACNLLDAEIRALGPKPDGLVAEPSSGPPLGFPARPFRNFQTHPRDMRRAWCAYIADEVNWPWARTATCSTKQERHCRRHHHHRQGIGAGYQPHRRRHGRRKVARHRKQVDSVSVERAPPIVARHRHPARWLCRGSFEKMILLARVQRAGGATHARAPPVQRSPHCESEVAPVWHRLVPTRAKAPFRAADAHRPPHLVPPHSTGMCLPLA